MSHRILTAAAARLTGASTAGLAAAGAPALITAPAAAEPAAGDPVDVVTVADAQAAVAAAETRGHTAGAEAERKRFTAVLNSEAGKGNVPLAVFMLENNPLATSDAIVAHLDTQPKATATAAPVAPAAAAAPAAPAAITNPLEQTPLITVAPNANNGDGGTADPKASEKLWDTAMASVSIVGTGPELAPGIPRTGN